MSKSKTVTFSIEAITKTVNFLVQEEKEITCGRIRCPNCINNGVHQIERHDGSCDFAIPDFDCPICTSRNESSLMETVPFHLIDCQDMALKQSLFSKKLCSVRYRCPYIARNML